MNQRNTVSMFYPFLIKKQKSIAWLLFLIFYFDFIGVAFAKNSIQQNVWIKSSYSTPYIKNKMSVNNRTFSLSKKQLLNTQKSDVVFNEGLNKSKISAMSSEEELVFGKPIKLDIGGPGQPEMATFKSIGADNMVNSFTGDFSYNIPLLDVGGYPVNLFYNAGITMEQEATWVGLGWNINPGVINRNMRGLPDDFNGEDFVTKEQSIKNDLSIGVAAASTFELVGKPKKIGVDLTVNAGVTWNNRRGLSLSLGANSEFSMQKNFTKINADDKTIKDSISKSITASAGININSMDGVTTNYGLSVSKKKFENDNIVSSYSGAASIDLNSLQGILDLRLSAEMSNYKNETKKGLYEGNQNLTFARSSYIPSIRMPLTSYNALLALKAGKEKKVLFKNWNIQGFLTDSYIAQKQKTQTKPAFGFMYYERANDDDNALMDFNRINDGVYTTKTPVISLPVYTYDVFNISGEGTGGSFRGYRGNIGYVKDNRTVSLSAKGSLSFDIGVKDKVHTGVTIGGAYSQTESGEWKQTNALKDNIKFNKSAADYLGFYFKNPSEKAIIDENFYNAVGQDKLIRPVLLPDGPVINGLTTIRSATPILASKYDVFNSSLQKESDISIDPTNTKRQERDKRSQVITFLTAEEADKVALDRYIWAYKENTFLPGSCKNPNFKTAFLRCKSGDPSYIRKSHHLSEITVLENDSKRYIYGLPVYTRLQKEITFSTSSGQVADSRNEITYAAGQNSTSNLFGEERFFQSQKLENFAHSFLLTQILSPDYVDVTGDGVTDDDLGSAVKFNYSCANILPSGVFEPYKWRYPFGSVANKATFNEGLKTDHSDNKASYTYGSKELWYLHTIESKNMVATFRVSKREDGRQAIEEDGNINNNVCQRKLERIDLYTKADYQKNGANAIPVKSVHFSYNYELCKGFGLNANSSEGKLTLKSVWFTYNGSNKRSGVYVFGYSSTKNNINTNPDYNTTENDRWGNYKPVINNLDNLSNTDYSYALQDKLKADAYASAWNLEKILLPSGSVINVDYEADSYSYVQNRRATIVTKIAGFGKHKTSTPTNKLYTVPQLNAAALMGNSSIWDHRFVFFDVPQPLTSKSEIYEKYLNGIKQLLLKLWVQVPTDSYGGGYEPIFIYSTIQDYNIVQGNNSRFYIELTPTSSGGSPIMETIVDYMRRTLTSKVFPAYKNKEGGALKQVVKALHGMGDQVKKAVKGFEASLKSKGVCSSVNLNRSTARLTVPNFSKLGGGYRVKRIVISDNWDQLTKLGGVIQEKGSFYGQEYDYTTTENVLDQNISISSGVATYEPGVGNDENPFREVLKYDEKQPLGPTRKENIEMPIAETFFPTPMVGYSKVTVRSIHNRSNKNIKSGVGKQVSEFYTCKDFPVFADFTSFDNQSKRSFKPGPIEQIFQFKKKDLLTLTQGFRVVLNDMNGKPKANFSYPEGDDKTVINSTQYYYRTDKIGENKYRLNNKVPVIADANGVVTNKLMGKDVEVMNDSRDHYTYTYSGQLPLNLEFFTASNFPILIPTIFKMFFRDESLFRSQTTLKVVNEYGILESVTNNDKGSIVSTENMVYDAETGNVLVSKSNNEFKKPIYNFNYPAHWAETGVEPAYKNIDVTYDGVLFRNGRLESPVNMNLFESGDELFVVDKAPAGPIPVAGCNTINGDNCEKLPQNPENRIWAVDLRKDPSNINKEFIFLDRYGTPYNGASVTLRIIRSGKRNLIDASLGSIVSENNPLVLQANNAEKLTIDNNTNVINASAALLKEKWKGQDMFYIKDTTYVASTVVPIRRHLLYPIANHTLFKKKRTLFGTTTENNMHFSNTPTLNQYSYFQKVARSGGGQAPGETSVERTNNWLLFDFQNIPNAAKIFSAKLSLLVHNENYTNCTGVSDVYVPHAVNRPQMVRLTGSLGGNDIYVNRMKSPWYLANDDVSWGGLFDNENFVDVNNNAFIPNVGNANVNHNATYNGNGQIITDRRINVTSTISNMLTDIRQNGKNYCYGLRLKPKYYSGGPSTIFSGQQCFATMSNTCQNSFLEIFYYDCNDPEHTDQGYGLYNCGNTTVTTTLCMSVFTKQFMNPYVQGILGNWRPWRNYVFYGERRESDPNNATNIAKDGILKDFVPFWVTNNTTGKIESTTSTKWVWNNETTQYNRKGAQLEEHDALNRYNAAIYGYQETLPIATVNNSRLRLSAFDGFEDYGYKDDPCEPHCKPAKKHFISGVTESMLDNIESHTGNYSLKLSSQTYNINMPVSPDNTNLDPVLKVDVLKNFFNDTSTVVNGSGINAYRADDGECLEGIYANGTRTNLDHYQDNDGHNRSFQFRGRLIVPKTGYYTFKLTRVNDYAAMYFSNEGYPFLRGNDWISHCWPNGQAREVTKLLKVGQVYPIHINCMNRRSGGWLAGFTIMWRKPCETNFTIVSTPNLYLETQPNPVVTYGTGICYKPNQIQATQNAIIDDFNLIPDKRMQASIWIKKGGQDCKCSTYVGLAINIKNTATGEILKTLKATNKIIEGWQLFEGDFIVPQNTNQLQLSFVVDAGQTFYVDDLRIHPFNANMKSFVFDPQTLRLISELDENNYASFYEYDDEGTLVRVKKETKDGIKTITETRSAIQSKIIGL